MKMIRRHRTVRLKVSNLTELPCKVAFEPLGDQAQLPAWDLFDVEISGPGDGVVEVSFAKLGLIIGESDGAKNSYSKRARRKRADLLSSLRSCA
jgi:hypothetical protein